MVVWTASIIGVSVQGKPHLILLLLHLLLGQATPRLLGAALHRAAQVGSLLLSTLEPGLVQAHVIGGGQIVLIQEHHLRPRLAALLATSHVAVDGGGERLVDVKGHELAELTVDALLLDDLVDVFDALRL